MKKKNVLITATIAAALIAAFVYLPLPYSVKAPLEVQPRDATTVYALVPGRLESMKVQPGQQVQSGEEVAVLSNEDLQLQVIELEQAVSQYEKQIEVFQRVQSTGQAAEVSARLPELFELLESSRKQLAKLQEEVRKLRVKANAAGTIMPARIKKSPPGGDGQLPQWKGSLLDPENLGAFLQDNDEICRIGDPSHFEAMLAVDQADINSIHAGQKVRIKLDAYADQVFETIIESEEDISRKPMSMSPESMAVQTGGALATQTDASGMARPLSATYQVKVPLPEGLREFKIGQRGRAKISAEPLSLGQRCWRYLTRTFHFEL